MMIISTTIFAGSIYFLNIMFFVYPSVWDLLAHLKILQWKLLRELATVKDGTVQFEVPEDIRSQSLDFGAGVAYSDGITEEDGVAKDYHVTPLEIVMLIVGTRGDVQPFVAIGKCLQVIHIFFFFKVSLQSTSIRIYLILHINLNEIVV